MAKYDPAPNIPAAGYGQISKTESAAACIFPRDQAPRPPTPDNVRKYRGAYSRPPGTRTIHHGFRDLQPPDPTARFGMTTNIGERIDDCLKYQPKNAMEEFITAQSESVYASRTREPLGSGYVRGHVHPVQTRDLGSFIGFGKPSKSDISAGSLIHYAPEDEKELDDDRELNHFTREKTVTKPLDRKYDWGGAGIDPTDHRFGKVLKDEVQGVGELLQDHGGGHTTFIVQQSMEEVRRAKQAPIGRNRNVKDNVASLPEDFTFGVKGENDGGWGAAECLRGNYDVADQMPDKDLGISTRKLKNIQQIPYEETRRYGVPSIRHDRAKPNTTSVSNGTNWGDETDAKGLIFPNKYDFDGLHLDTFKAKRSLAEIKIVFDRMGAGLTDQDYDRLANLAVSETGILSVDSFRHAMNNADQLEAQQAAEVASRDLPATPVYANAMDAYRSAPPISTQPASRSIEGRRKSPYRTGDNKRASEDWPLRPQNTGKTLPYRNASTITF